MSVRRLLAWVAGLALIAAVVSRLKRRRTPAPVAPPETAPDVAAVDDPAEELRDRLARSRADEPAAPAADEAPAGDAPEGGAVAADEPASEPASLDERRARVHERAQEAIDAMREPPEGA